MVGRTFNFDVCYCVCVCIFCCKPIVTMSPENARVEKVHEVRGIQLINVSRFGVDTFEANKSRVLLQQLSSVWTEIQWHFSIPDMILGTAESVLIKGGVLISGVVLYTLLCSRDNRQFPD